MRLPAVWCGRLVVAAQGAKTKQVGTPASATNAIALTQPNHIWSMNFVSDALFDGRRLRALTVIDHFTREYLAIEVGESLKGEDVAAAMARPMAARSVPQVDQGRQRQRTRRTRDGSLGLSTGPSVSSPVKQTVLK